MSITTPVAVVEFNESTSVNTRNFTVPTVVTGDSCLLVLNVATGNATFTVTDSGMTTSFTAVAAAITASGFTSQVFKVTNLNSTDSGKTVTVATAVSGTPTLMKISGGARFYRGTNLTDIVSAYSNKNAGATLSPTTSGVTTAHEGCGQVHIIGMFRGANTTPPGTTPNVSTLTVNSGQGVTDDFSAFTSGTASLSATAVAADYTPLAVGSSIGSKAFTSDQSVQYAAWTIALRPGNLSPVVSAGSDQVVASGATVTMAGTASDPDGTETHAWSFTVYASGSAPTLTGGTTLVPTWTATTAGLYTLRLRSTDNNGAITDAFVNVTVTTTSSRANSLITSGSFVAVGAATVYAATADESTSTYAESAAAPAGALHEQGHQPCPVGAYTVKYDLVSDTASPTVSCVVSLMQGTTTIASWTESAIGTTPISRVRALTSGQQASITNPLALSLRYVATQD